MENKANVIQFATEKNFYSLKEFECKCGCGENNIDIDLVAILNDASGKLNRKIGFTSACRCETHNKKVGGVLNSTHVSTPKKKCKGIDLVCKNGSEFFQLVKCFINTGVRRMIYHPRRGFLHIDIDRTRSQDFIIVELDDHLIKKTKKEA